MKDAFSKIVATSISSVIIFIGIIYVMASTVDPSNNVSRLIVGVVLIIFGIVFFSLFFLIIERHRVKVVKVDKKTKKQLEDKLYVPPQVICKSCHKPVVIEDYMKNQDVVYCENCGEPVNLKEFDVNW